MKVVLVESPAKAKTINKYLGKEYKVLASYGHIRDLPSKDGSVDPDNNFQMLWEIDTFSKKYLKEITDTAADSNKIILATDPDREGEAIAWHVKEVLDQKKLLKGKKIERVVFNEITKKAVAKGIENPRDIEPHLVDAYMARRALDYLVGFNISPILWTKLPGSKSAGRVQSVALKLISEREHEIEQFIPKEYWTISLNFKNKDGKEIPSKLISYNNNKVETFSLLNKETVDDAINKINFKEYFISDITSQVYKRNPTAPFTTSTMQQVASGKCGFGASRTMQIAQRLYQGIDIEGEAVGLITYMRTDSLALSEDAMKSIKETIVKKYGAKYHNYKKEIREIEDMIVNYNMKRTQKKEEMLRIKDRSGREMLYGPTNEELITDIFQSHISSYKDLPKNLFHIQWKFRDEVRPRFGVMRGREFLMKDNYSFDLDEDSAKISYNNMFSAYIKTFLRMGLTPISLRAETGPIGGNLSHEFQILASTGESTLYYDKELETLNPNTIDPEKLEKDNWKAKDVRETREFCETWT